MCVCLLSSKCCMLIQCNQVTGSCLVLSVERGESFFGEEGGGDLSNSCLVPLLWEGEGVVTP